jgi:hypothetical protein
MSNCPIRSKANILNILYGFVKLAKGFIEIHDKYPDVKTQAIRDHNAHELPIFLKAIKRIEMGEEPNKVLHETLKGLH